MPDITVCPNPAKLSQLLIGNASAVDLESFAGHLENCPACIKQLEQIERSRQVGKQSVRSGSPAPVAAPVQTIMNRIQKMVRSRVDPHHTANTPAPCDPIGQTSMGGAGRLPDPSYTDYVAWLEPPQSADEIGRLGIYRVLKVLGAGGMGVVFLAEDTVLKRRVAIKAMKPDLASSKDGRARFLREAQMMATVKHQNVITIHHAAEHKQIAFLVMEYLSGETLESRLRRECRLPIHETLRIGREVAEGLAAAHDHQLIHRDIKPANLWLEKAQNQVKILDFGLARAVEVKKRITQSGEVLGTPAYTAPEQASGKTVDGRADLFSLGIVLYRATTGNMPFPGADVAQVLLAICMEHPKPPRAVNPDVPEDVSSLIMHLLAKRPEERPSSAAELVTRLRNLERAHRPKPTKADAENATTVTHRIDRSKLTQLIEPEHVRLLKKAMRGKRWIAAAGVALAGLTLSICLLAFWAGGVLRVRTPEGTIVLQNLPAGAEVLVDDGRVAVNTGTGGLVEIRTQPGIKKLLIRKGGVVIHSEEVALEVGGRTAPIQIRLEPPAQAVPKNDSNPVPKAVQDGFVSLFNGKDLTGWVPDGPNQWRVNFGAIVSVSNGIIRTSRSDYKDFHLRAEVSLEAGACGSLQFRNTDGGWNTYRVTLDANSRNKDSSGSVIATPGRRILSNPGSKVISLEANRWYKVEVLAIEWRFVVSVDGKVVAEANDELKAYRSGGIALQRSFAIEPSIRFRNIEVKELESNESPPKKKKLESNESPPKKKKAAGDGFVPLFNGKDAAGWRASKHNYGGKMTIEDGVLVISAPKGQPANFVTDREYSDFHLRAEVRNMLSNTANILLRCSESQDTGYAILFGGAKGIDFGTLGIMTAKTPNSPTYLFRPPSPPSLDSLQWVRLDIVVNGSKVAVRVQEKLVVQHTDVRAYKSGTIRLGCWGPQEFRIRKLEIKELPAPEETGRLVWTDPIGKFEQVNDKVWLEQEANYSHWFRETGRHPDWVELHRDAEPWEKFRTATIRLHRDTAWVRVDVGPWTKIHDGAWGHLPAAAAEPFGQTTWTGNEARAEHGTLRFDFRSDDKVTVTDQNGKSEGTYARNGAAIILRLGGTRVYTGSVNGQNMSGVATDSKDRWKWALSKEPNAKASPGK